MGANSTTTKIRFYLESGCAVRGMEWIALMLLSAQRPIHELRMHFDWLTARMPAQSISMPQQHFEDGFVYKRRVCHASDGCHKLSATVYPEEKCDQGLLAPI
jgi:hypothetical protein